MSGNIRFDHVTKRFNDRTVLNDVSFETLPGEILYILGRSGVGKSVTLKHIVGLLKPSSGTVWVNEQDISKLSADGLAQIRRYCGMVFQHPALFDSLNVFENIAFGLMNSSFSTLEKRSLTKQALSLVSLDETLLDQKVTNLSYGMQKRVSLARTLVPKPQILLFDEPTTGLDPETTHAISQLILDLSRKLKVTSLVVSHDISSALKTADRILFLDQAKAIVLGSPQEIKKSSHPLVQAFLEESTSS